MEFVTCYPLILPNQGILKSCHFLKFVCKWKLFLFFKPSVKYAFWSIPHSKNVPYNYFWMKLGWIYCLLGFRILQHYPIPKRSEQFLEDFLVFLKIQVKNFKMCFVVLLYDVDLVQYLLEISLWYQNSFEDNFYWVLSYSEYIKCPYTLPFYWLGEGEFSELRKS